MKALFVSNDPSIFIPGTATQRRMQSYADAIGTLHIISRGPRTMRIELGNLTLHSVMLPKFLMPLQFPKLITKLIREEGIEIVSAQDPFEHGQAAAKAVKGTSAKLHIQVHTDVLSPWFTAGPSRYAPYGVMPVLNRVRKTMADQVLPQAAGIRVVSERIKESLVAKYGSRIPEPVVIPIAPPGDLPLPVPLPPKPFTFSLIAVGRLEAEKRIEDIITAFSYVAKRYPRLGLFIVGEGRDRKHLEKLVRTLGLAAQVVFLGDRPDAWGLMQSAGIFVQASAYEGYGRTLVEAALAGIPIITTDVGIVGEVFTPLEDLLASPPGDPNGFSFNIVRLMENIGDRKELATSAHAKVLAHLAEVHAGPEVIAADLARTLAR